MIKSFKELKTQQKVYALCLKNTKSANKRIEKQTLGALNPLGPFLSHHPIGALMIYLRIVFCCAFLPTLVAGLVFAPPAAAHKVSIFAWVEGNVVYTQSKFMGNRIPKSARIEVLDAAGKRLLEGITDSDGKFSFNAPYRGDLKIILHAGAGHQASWNLGADDFSVDSATRSASDSPLPNPDRHARKNDQPPAANALTEKKVAEIVTGLLRKEIEPLKEMIADTMQTTPSFRDVFGGIGYIIGLVGVAAYVRSRRK